MYFIGWDVGGWNCDKNPRSRDAIVILDAGKRICGTPWRGNLRVLINQADTTETWLEGLFGLCKAPLPARPFHVTLGIDTPLAFSTAFVELITTGKPVDASVEGSNENPYIFRETERFLFRHGLAPLSAIKDMIGSQATKGMHVLGKFAPTVARCGVWSDGAILTAFEAYPSACKTSSLMADLRADFAPLDHLDMEDALTCALVAYLYATRIDALCAPPEDIPEAEGWIWFPADVVRKRQGS